MFKRAITNVPTKMKKKVIFYDKILKLTENRLFVRYQLRILWICVVSGTCYSFKVNARPNSRLLRRLDVKIDDFPRHCQKNNDKKATCMARELQRMWWWFRVLRTHCHIVCRVWKCVAKNCIALYTAQMYPNWFRKSLPKKRDRLRVKR